MIGDFKLSRSLILLLHQFQALKESAFGFLSLLFLFLLAYNGLSVLCIFPPSPAPSTAESAVFSHGIIAGESVERRPPLSSSLQVVKSNSSNFRNGIRRIRRSAKRPAKRPRKHKRHLRSLRQEPPENEFSTRIEDFFAANSCKLRFFMTWISPLNSFQDREILAIESLFKSHGDACLVIVSNSMDSTEGRKILRPFLENGFKVIAIPPDFGSIFRETAAENWFNRLRQGIVKPGEVSLGQNLSNLLRLVLLYKFGGIYVDADILILKSFSNLRNAIGAQTIDRETGKWSRLNNAVLIFDKHHPLLLQFIEEFAETFDGNKWGHNGPYLVSRVVSRLNQSDPGFNFSVLPPSSFYPVVWSRIGSLFHGPKDKNHSKWLLGKLRQIRFKSLALHLWNRHSRKLDLENGSIVDHIRWNCCIFCNFSMPTL